MYAMFYKRKEALYPVVYELDTTRELTERGSCDGSGHHRLWDYPTQPRLQVERSRPKGLDLDKTPYGGLVKETVLCATVMAITLSK